MNTILPADKTKLEQVLFTNIKHNLEQLTKLLDKINAYWGYEDLIYRFYHRSYKVYSVQKLNEEIIQNFRSLLPERKKLATFFEQLIAKSPKIRFELHHNQDWINITRPMLELFFHAKYFLEMMVKYWNELEHLPTDVLKSGYASILSLYRIR